ncbi:hypothetical protein [Streptomyces sp. 351MFTsu5.1]|uniref:hypothetical protein n=1 Tax=Streptomyces sp. 351MFTsu5.1 TaxID=1172180 RepID=UPI00035F5A3E|nr:hypothetical protein [Streptomyces sp. 351MFTsu5.1]
MADTARTDEDVPPVQTGKGRSRRFRLSVILAVLAALFATAPVYVWVVQGRRVTQVADGVRAVGTFHAEGANCWRHRCWVDFVVDGKRVEADLPALTSARKNKVARDGEPIVVRYRASDPTVVAEDDGTGYVFAMTALTSIPAFGLLIAALTCRFPVRRAKRLS